MLALRRQRVFGVALGHCDLNDHEVLRGDPDFQTAVSRVEPLASAATLRRFEQGADTRFTKAVDGPEPRTLQQSRPRFEISRGTGGYWKQR